MNLEMLCLTKVTSTLVTSKESNTPKSGVKTLEAMYSYFQGKPCLNLWCDGSRDQEEDADEETVPRKYRQGIPTDVVEERCLYSAVHLAHFHEHL